MTDAGGISFKVPGTPQPQGSKRHVGRGVLVESNEARLRPWRDTLAWHAHEARGDKTLLTGPVSVRAAFYMPRPKSHYRRDGSVKASAPFYHCSRPDGDKLARALLDALTGVLFHDDGQVAVLSIRKCYDLEPSCVVTVDPLATVPGA